MPRSVFLYPFNEHMTYPVEECLVYKGVTFKGATFLTNYRETFYGDQKEVCVEMKYYFNGIQFSAIAKHECSIDDNPFSIIEEHKLNARAAGVVLEKLLDTREHLNSLFTEEE